MKGVRVRKRGWGFRVVRRYRGIVVVTKVLGTEARTVPNKRARRANRSCDLNNMYKQDI